MQGGSNQQSYSIGNQGSSPQGYPGYNLPTQNPYQNIWNGLSLQNSFSNLANQQIAPQALPMQNNTTPNTPVAFTQADNNAVAGISNAAPNIPSNTTAPANTLSVGGVNIPSNTPPPAPASTSAIPGGLDYRNWLQAQGLSRGTMELNNKWHDYAGT